MVGDVVVVGVVVDLPVLLTKVVMGVVRSIELGTHLIELILGTEPFRFPLTGQGAEGIVHYSHGVRVNMTTTL